MGLLTGKTILLISSQPWDHIPISKHNYALELLRRGNRVFFLEPPLAARGRRAEVRAVPNHVGLFTVSCSFPIPMWLRFHARPVYDRWMRHEIARIAKAIGQRPDVVWSFEFNLYMDLRAFGGDLAIYHIVDPISLPAHVAVARSADAVFAVSQSILSMFAGEKVPSFLLGHGLSQTFADEPMREWDAPSSPKLVGYSGNLMHRAVNRGVLRQCVSENPDVEFHFWGPADLDSVADELERDELLDFVAFLERSANVRLHGRVSQSGLAHSLTRMDCLVLSYQPVARGFDRSNSHKMLEYLSTGNVVVSSRLLEYADRGDMIRLAVSDDDSDLPSLLSDTLEKLATLNSPALREKRRQFALDHTYARQIDRIEECLASIDKAG